MSRRPQRARRVMSALLMVLLTACQTWRPTFVSPQQLIPAEQPSSVRLTLRIGATVTYENPTVRNDSIFGVHRSVVGGVALEDLDFLEVRQFSVPRTIGLGLLVLYVLSPR